VKKLISIGVALALLTMAVVPAAVAADDLSASNYTAPQTYAKTPFALIASGFSMLTNLWPSLDSALGMDMPWLGDVFEEFAYWTYGPLAWTVDMMGWGIALGADVVGDLDAIIEGMGLELPFAMSDVSGILSTVACGLRTCFDDTCAGNWTCNVTG